MFEKDKVKNEWLEVDGVFGRQFTDLSTVKSIFLPAAGYRGSTDGTLGSVGTGGDYWSSTEYSSHYAYNLGFGSDDAGLGYSTKSYGFSVRHVAE